MTAKKTVKSTAETEAASQAATSAAEMAPEMGETESVLDGQSTVIQELEQKLGESQAKANEYLEGWQRARAEFANYKKRIEREQSLVYQNAAGSILKRQLEIMDDLDRALKNRPSDGEGASWAEGIELIQRKMMMIFENEGLKVMQPLGEMFDPTLHEAIASEDNDNFTSGQVIDVLQKGYTLGERVLRPAMVRVAR